MDPKALVRPAFIGHSPRADTEEFADIRRAINDQNHDLFVTQRDHGIDAHGAVRGYVAREYGGSSELMINAAGCSDMVWS
jgi:hypothetical protein